MSHPILSVVPERHNRRRILQGWCHMTEEGLCGAAMVRGETRMYEVARSGDGEGGCI